MISQTIKTFIEKDDSKKIREVIKKAKGAYVTIGIHKEAGTYPSGEEVVKVALWNEFGTDNMPERAFFRTAIDKHEGQINAWREKAIDDIINGKMTVHKALESIGFKIMTLIQNQIKSNTPPPNAPSTVQAKQRAGVAPNTLIWSGLMLRSVTYKVYA